MRTEHLWGLNDLDALFSNHVRIVVPWRAAGRLKTWDPLERDEITAVLGRAPVLGAVDPRTLRASQTWLVRHHVAYYLTEEWERSGRTSADMASATNRYPVVSFGRTGARIVTGHHRAAAALLQGRLLQARLVGAGAVANDMTVVTPGLVVRLRGGGDGSVDDDGGTGPSATTRMVMQVASYELAEVALREIGLDDHQVADRVHMASTGRTLSGR